VRTLIITIAVAVASAGCTPSRAPCAIPTAPKGAPLLWRVQHDNSPPLWLFGTIHDNGASAVPDAAWKALDGAARFASEVGDYEPDPDEFRAAARLPLGTVLDRLLPRDDWWTLVNTLSGTMKEEDLRHARPWFALFRLHNTLASSPRPSMDAALVARAKQRGIAIEHLETWREQAAALDQAVQSKELSRAIRERERYACDLDGLRAAYFAADVVALGRMLDVEAGSALLVARNQRWLPLLERYANTTGAFVAIGLGHLLGENGLLKVLEAKGYKIERARK
jgi:uncharacterized protein YbaP (TraB family)